MAVAGPSSLPSQLGRLLTRALRVGSGHGRLAATLEAERERWFLWSPVVLGIGIALYFWSAREPGWGAVAAAVVMPAALLAVVRRGVVLRLLLAALTLAALGFAVAKVKVWSVAAPTLARPMVNVEVRGIIELVEPRPGRGQRLTVAVGSLGSLGDEDRPKRIRFRTLTTRTDLRPGQAIRVVANLAPPARPAYPGDFDFARLAWLQGIGAVGFALRKVERDAVDPPLGWRLWLAVQIEGLRQAITERIRRALPGEQGAIAAALITGERAGISEATNDAYRQSGLFHILSISGLHMVVMAGSVFVAVRVGLAAVPALALAYPTKKWAAGVAALAALAYMLISGTAAATVRSWIMITIGFAAVMADRTAIALRTVALAALAILVLQPDGLLDAGFQMSFAAVTALVAVYEEVRRRRRADASRQRFRVLTGVLTLLGGIVLSTLVAGVAVAPLAAYHFHQSQQYAVLANLVAVPVCNLVVMPAALATLVLMPLGLEGLGLAVMAVGIDIMTRCAEIVASLPGASIAIAETPTPAFALIIAGGLWMALWQTRWRLAGLAAIALGVALVPALRDPPDAIIGRDGRLVALRDGTGMLNATPVRGATFEMRRWLERDGDRRSPAAAMTGHGFRCDPSGCIASLKRQLVAIPRHPAAVAEDCRRADIVVLTVKAPPSCQPRALLIDRPALMAGGTHAIWFGASGVRVATVATIRGERPWSGTMPATSRLARTGTGDPLRPRLGAFASPHDLQHGEPQLRPEIEDDEAMADQ